jgi:(E)-4-hydroxy-3-methyl-but-2-enyl pyrophosphate reductase
MGVRRAMELVLTEANRKKSPLFTFGPLIHNHQVLDLLASKGVMPVEDLTGIEAGTIIIRAHGIPHQKRLEIKRTGLNVIDATCPRVARVQAIIRYNSKKGATPIIVGNEGHPEVVGLVGYSQTSAHVVQDVLDISALPHLDPVFVVAQTTQNEEKFLELVAALKERFPHITVFNTICDATHQRQEEVRSFSGQVDAMVVVGGYHSGNTKRLVEVSREAHTPTFHVETVQDLDKELLSGMKVIGVTAGASTPNWLIKNVVREVENIRGKREPAIYRLFKNISKLLLATKVVVASGAFCLAYAAALLSGRAHGLIEPLLAFLYVYAMHAVNPMLDRGASDYNDPERAAFLRKNRGLMITTGLGAIGSGLWLSYFVGNATFIAFCALTLFGMAYSLPLIPARLRRAGAYYKIKHIPGSRSFSEALAWVTVIEILPLLGPQEIRWAGTGVSCLIVLSMSYARAILFDVFQVQGDLIVGAETLPTFLGEKRALALVKGILIAALLILIVSPFLNIVAGFGHVLLPSVAGLFFCLIAYERRWLYTGTTLEALVEANFLLAGLLALIWRIF